MQEYGDFIICGIVSVIGKIGINQEKAFRTLLVLDSLRGEDSTGMLAVGKFQGAECKIAKQVGDPFALFDTKQYDNAMRTSSRVLLGHNRYATQGGINRANAHPFEHKTIIGVHNGTISNKWNLVDSKDFKVDSDNMYHHMEKLGIDSMLEKADGAWALVWWNKEEETFNILRNNERPLFGAISCGADGKADWDCMYFASEAWMLNVALAKSNITHTPPEMIDKDSHFKIPVCEGGQLGKPTMVAAPGTYKPTYQNNSVWHNQTNVVPLKGTTNPETKKPESNVTAAGTDFDRNYLRYSNVTFELLAEATDKDGGKYLSLFDPKNQYKEIRLYPRKADDVLWDMLGCDIQGDIGGFVQSGSTSGRGYYKVAPDSVKLLVTPEKEEETVTAPNGKQMTQKQFEQFYSSCGYCSNPLDWKASNKYSTMGECFCPDCSENKDVVEMVKFIN